MINSGTCSDSLTWGLYDEGELTVKGNRPMSKDPGWNGEGLGEAERFRVYESSIAERN